jgi:hypothetical protein
MSFAGKMDVTGDHPFEYNKPSSKETSIACFSSHVESRSKIIIIIIIAIIMKVGHECKRWTMERG